MSKTLDQIRKKIDALDNQVHDLLMERATLIGDIAKEKRKKNLPVVHPAREAMMMRRLMDRHSGRLPEAAVVRIWRELVGAVSILQGGLNVTVTMPELAGETYWDMARNYFGSVLPMKKASHALGAIASVREEDANFAVVPWPEDGEENPWWAYILEPSHNMRIICRLPYGCSEEESCNSRTRALVVSKLEFQESGDDNSFIMVSTVSGVSRGKINDACKSAGFEPISIHTKAVGSDTPGLFLVEVEGFLTEDDERLNTLGNSLEEYEAVCSAAGGYPVPPIYPEMDLDYKTAPKAPKAKAKKKTQRDGKA